MSGEPQFGEPVGVNAIAGLAVAFKALVLRAGGRVEISAPARPRSATAGGW